VDVQKMSKQELKQKGFTIIEVVLVLAIAALIFLMVFIALPALQRSQRDTARKSDVSIIAAAVSSYQGNNRSGGFPDSSSIGKYAENVSGNTDLSALAVGSAPADGTEVTVADDAKVVVYPEAKCNSVAPGGKVTLDKGTKRQYAVVTRLESGSNSGYCLDS
jgi:prepilin-type N-terminal cleavage/methylation domain-containing protein